MRIFYGKSENYSFSLSYIHWWKLKSHKSLWLFFAYELSKHDSDARNEFYAQFYPRNKVLVNFTVWGRSKIVVREGGSGAPSCFPGLPSFPQYGSFTREGHPKFISMVKLCVEFISGIRIVFGQFISDKKIPKVLPWSRNLKFLSMYVREREKFSDFPKKNLTKFFSSKNLPTHQKSASETTQNFHNVDFPKNCLPVSSLLSFSLPPLKYERKRERNLW